jgi:signal transduction histidine kinase
MKLTGWSLGGKLILSAAATLLLCLLFFSIISWTLLKYLSEHQAKSDATIHLTLIKQAYNAESTMLINSLTEVASNADIISNVPRRYTLSPHNHLVDTLNPYLARYRLSELAIIAANRELLAHLGDLQSLVNLGDPIKAGMLPVVDSGLRGQAASMLRKMSLSLAGASPTTQQWALSLAIPIRNSNNELIAVLMASQAIDDYFARDLVQTTGLNVVLCESMSIVGTTVDDLHPNRLLSEETLCNIDASHQIDSLHSYLTLATFVQARDQITSSPSLTVVDVEPLYSSNSYGGKVLPLLIALGIFMLALGVTGYTLIARALFVLPVRRLQAHVTALVANIVGVQKAPPSRDELGALASSFNQLAKSVHLQGRESEIITEQMKELLNMSDMLISTVNLDHLLGEIVSRLGSMMQVKHISLLLYGREMDTPWAVAQWTEQPPMAARSAVASSQRPTVTVYTDPDGDVTLVMTTKLAAIPNFGMRASSPSGKRSIIRPPRLALQEAPFGRRRTRIPGTALRELDMMLARLAMQKQKIVCSEDVTVFNQKHSEPWARMALEAGYQSVIAVPLLLQEQPMGAFMLYRDTPYQMSSQDTFPLSTAAIQAAMAIQNALLFAEVKEKNAALERVNRLKSEFLATVTHELRTPLHSIISYGAFILDGFDGQLSSEQTGHIQIMVRSAEDLSHLVGDMLDLSKIEADRLEVKIEQLSLEQCLTEVIDQLKPIASAKGLYLILDMEEALPLVLADSIRLRQVVTNMASNALKFTENGGVTIHSKMLFGYDILRVSVIDTGIGISPAALEYIFEAFRQADGSTTRRFGGTGLGLTIARKLIELQGGEVAVESTLGQGSTFSFTLPTVSTTKTRL